jgi:P27 family predicted phage terminase small subunit
MGSRGPQKTPTKILQLRGSRRGKERPDEVDYGSEPPDCPKELVGEARREWHRQMACMQAIGLVAPVDRALLAAFCEAWAEFIRLVQEIHQLSRKEGLAGYKKAIDMKLVKVKDQAAARLIRLAGEFGFSPAARTRVKMPEKIHEDDEFFRNEKTG